MRYGMVIDLRKCIGCNACTMACKQKNGMPPGLFLSKVLVTEIGQFPKVTVRYLPVLCMHCADAPCVDVCPTGATQKLANGIVTVDPEKCIGCRYCMAACPFSARSFNFAKSEAYFPGMEVTAYEKYQADKHLTGTVEKCDFCMDRVEAGQLPACVQTCPAKARIFGDLDDPNSEVSQLIASRGGKQLYPELGTDPSVYYLPG